MPLSRSKVSQTGPNAILQLVTWLLLALMSLMLGFRLLTRFFIKGGRRFLYEDVLILLSFMLGLGESITVVIPEASMFGRDIHTISDDSLRAGLKAGYVRDIFFTLCIAFSRLSFCSGLFELTPSRNHRILLKALVAFVIVLGMVSFIASAFQCGIRGPWDARATCFDQNKFLSYVSISGISAEVGLVVVPMIIILPLQMPIGIRFRILIFYSSRILVIIVLACQLAYQPRLFEENFTLRAFPWYMCMQFIQFTSITAACVVYFWPFLRSLRSGLMHANNPLFVASHNQFALSNLTRTDAGNPKSGEVLEYTPNRSRKGYMEIVKPQSSK